MSSNSEAATGSKSAPNEGKNSSNEQNNKNGDPKSSKSSDSKAEKRALDNSNAGKKRVNLLSCNVREQIMSSIMFFFIL